MTTKPNWTKGLETRQAATEAVVGDENADAVGDGAPRLSALNGIALDLAGDGGAGSAGRITLALLGVRLFGPEPVGVSMWKEGDPEPDATAWADRAALGIDLAAADLDTTVIVNVAITDALGSIPAPAAIVSKIQTYVLAQDGLGVGGP